MRSMSKGRGSCWPSWSRIVAKDSPRSAGRLSPRPWRSVAEGEMMEIVASREPLNVLFLCTGNSARSILAEAILNRLGGGKFRGFSAGSQPAGYVHPLALQLLKNTNYDVAALRSKPWDEFAVPGAPKLDFVFTVCDNAANEVCPIWPGQPMSAHWGVPDPAAVQGTEAEKRFAFADTYRMMTNRISIFTSLRSEEHTSELQSLAYLVCR